jgi:pimeloyl-ACP methyl ester carboxylesterase
MPPLVSLARWLGPWAADRIPRGIRREEIAVPSHDGPVRAYVYEPRGAASGAYFVAPGLHFQGPDDTRFDRFNRILAEAGFLVVAPFIRSYVALELAESAFGDARAAFTFLARRARERGLARPGVFSISFGSSLAFDLASHPETRDDVGGLVVFGGFCDFVPTVRFAVTGTATSGARELRLARDPLNAPVVYLNVLPFLDVDGDKAILAEAYREMVRRTWNQPELKLPGARDPIARSIADRLPESLRAPFLRGCGLAPDAVRWLETGLDRAGEALSFIDPKPKLAGVRARTVVVHGRDDDVIPYVEADKIVRHLPPGVVAGKFITGLYGHTTTERPSATAVAREIVALAGMLRALADAPRGRL